MSTQCVRTESTIPKAADEEAKFSFRLIFLCKRQLPHTYSHTNNVIDNSQVPKHVMQKRDKMEIEKNTQSFSDMSEINEIMGLDYVLIECAREIFRQCLRKHRKGKEWKESFRTHFNLR